MALLFDVTIPGGVKVPGAYCKLVNVVRSKVEGVVRLVFLNFASEGERRKPGGQPFSPIEVVLPAKPQPEKIVDAVDPDGKPIKVRVAPAVESANELAAKPLSTWMSVPEGVTTARELLDHLTYDRVEAAFGYGVAKTRPEFAGAVDV